jgi:hypothetical protein
MSAIIIKWINKNLGYEHTALLLNNLGTKQSLYVSVYQPVALGSLTHRFASQTFEYDFSHNDITDYVVIPTCEDGNKFGLSEGVIAKFWMELYGFKKVQHQEFIAEQTHEEKLEASSSTASKNESSDTISSNLQGESLEKHTGKINALTELSIEFEKFTPHSFFSTKTVLDCTKFIAKLLQKGGLDLFLDPKQLKGYLGVSQLIGLAEQAQTNIVNVQNAPTKIKDPHFKKQLANNWTDRQALRR